MSMDPDMFYQKKSSKKLRKISRENRRNGILYWVKLQADIL